MRGLMVNYTTQALIDIAKGKRSPTLAKILSESESKPDHEE